MVDVDGFQVSLNKIDLGKPSKVSRQLGSYT